MSRYLDLTGLRHWISKFQERSEFLGMEWQFAPEGMQIPTEHTIVRLMLFIGDLTGDFELVKQVDMRLSNLTNTAGVKLRHPTRTSGYVDVNPLNGAFYAVQLSKAQVIRFYKQEIIAT